MSLLLLLLLLASGLLLQRRRRRRNGIDSWTGHAPSRLPAFGRLPSTRALTHTRRSTRTHPYTRGLVAHAATNAAALVETSARVIMNTSSLLPADCCVLVDNGGCAALGAGLVQKGASRVGSVATAPQICSSE
ncbi:hypothetical protein Y032_0662g1289 [Ancylostoma ceylanicum]|uniref:Secreted protein n=1 Tax=Ancylostoma ceylanicum TaxID=53326 RepID=A0A016WI76_9BILA|nr:hypothetical protein Y032_0662g1289 [Ancylostoma ceylanicum]